MLQVKPINTGGGADIGKLLDLFQNEMQRRRQLKDQQMQEANFAYQQQQRKQAEATNALRYNTLKESVQPGGINASSSLYDMITKYESGGVPVAEAEQQIAQRIAELKGIDERKAKVDVEKAKQEKVKNSFANLRKLYPQYDNIITANEVGGGTTGQALNDIQSQMTRESSAADRAANKAERAADRAAKPQSLLESQSNAANDNRMLRNTGKNYDNHTVKIYGNDVEPNAQLISKGVVYMKNSKGYWVADSKGKKKVWKKLTENKRGNYAADKFNAPGSDKILPSVIRALDAGYTDFQNNVTKTKGKVFTRELDTWEIK